MVKNLRVYSVDSSINKRAVHKLLSNLKSDLRLDISFLAINFIKSSVLITINKEYLKHDYYTDVITFNYAKKKNVIDGEILISYEDARLNAKRYRATYSKELARLVVHGVLHLLNFNDNNKKNKNIMKQMENKLINRYNFILLAVR